MDNHKISSIKKVRDVKNKYEPYYQYFKRRLFWKVFKITFPKTKKEFEKRAGDLANAQNQIRLKHVVIQELQAEIRRLNREKRKN